MDETKQGSAVIGVRGGRSRKKKGAGRGSQLLSDAANKAIEQKSSEIAQMLLDTTLAGSVNSARFLVALADSKRASAEVKKKRHGLSQAQKLEQEQQWRDSTEKRDQGHDETEVACR